MLLLISIHNMFWAFALVFTACELGERVRNEFEGVCFLIGQLKWYLFPLNSRQLVPTIMINSQHPVEFKCFGSISCSRESFRKVSKKKSISILTIKLFIFSRWSKWDIAIL